MELIRGGIGSGVSAEGVAEDVTALRRLAVQGALPVLVRCFLRSSLSRERAIEGGRPETRTVGRWPCIGSGDVVRDVRFFQFPTILLYADGEECKIISGWFGGEEDIAP